MRRVLISLALLLVYGTGMANDHTGNRQFIHDQLQMDRQHSRALRTPEFLQRQWSAGVENQVFLDAQAPQLRQSTQPGERPVNAALVFVSFSMPPDELKRHVKDTMEFDIPIVIRGTVNDDTRTTANTVAGLVKESSTGGVQIDPTTFRKYNITAVSVLTIAYDNQNDTVDWLQEDLTLHQALERVIEVRDHADTARNLLHGEVQ